MTFNVKEVNKEVKDSKELAPIVKKCNGCGKVRELYKLDGEDSKDLCKNCIFKWLIMNSKEIC